LKNIIDARASILGDTPSGVDWCIKALHPSDPLTEVRGIPDKSAVPSLLLNYQSTATIKPTVGATGVWSFDSTLLPHPVAPFFGVVTDSIHPQGYVPFNHLNPQLDGITHAEKFASFAKLAQRWRLAYMSATVYLDAPDLSNQGTIVVSQVPISFLETNGAFAFEEITKASPMMTTKISQPGPEDYPQFDKCQAMPNAYFNRAREGAYVPLKLTKTCQQWHSMADSTMFCVTSHSGDPNYPVIAAPPASVTGVGGYPFPSLTPFGVTMPLNQDNTTWTGQLTSALCNDTVAHICAKNLSVNSGVTIFFRMGYELQVVADSVLSPQLKLSPPYDSTALKHYFAISRELKDAYPADYNDLGKMWDVISGVAKTVAPWLRLIPGIGAALSMGVSGAAMAGDAVKALLTRASNAKSSGKVSSVGSEADRNVAKQMIAFSKEKIENFPSLPNNPRQRALALAVARREARGSGRRH